MDTSVGCGLSQRGYYGPLAMGRFPSYNPRDDGSDSDTEDQLVITDKQGGLRCAGFNTKQSTKQPGPSEFRLIYQSFSVPLRHNNAVQLALMGARPSRRTQYQRQCYLCPGPAPTLKSHTSTRVKSTRTFIYDYKQMHFPVSLPVI